MTDTAGPDAERAFGLVARGEARLLEGRGLNDSYRVDAGGSAFSVKVHRPEDSGPVRRQRIREVDAALRGAPWDPPLLDARLCGPRSDSLVVVRPFVAGRPVEDARTCIADVVAVLAELRERAQRTQPDAELLGDYASRWLEGDGAGSSAGDVRRLLSSRLGERRWRELARRVESHLPQLREGAAGLTPRRGGVTVHHGDLHGRNLVLGGPRGMAVIDWDEAGFSRRPSDAGKALWFSCRLGRGDFALDGGALERFLREAHTRLGLPYGDAAGLARTGALWFLPAERHVSLLERRDPAVADWYLGWVEGFWTRLGRNLELVARTAEALAGERRGGGVDG